VLFADESVDQQTPFRKAGGVDSRQAGQEEIRERGPTQAVLIATSALRVASLLVGADRAIE
jgi:hypothetical protein